MGRTGSTRTGFRRVPGRRGLIGRASLGTLGLVLTCCSSSTTSLPSQPAPARSGGGSASFESAPQQKAAHSESSRPGGTAKASSLLPRVSAAAAVTSSSTGLRDDETDDASEALADTISELLASHGAVIVERAAAETAMAALRADVAGSRLNRNGSFAGVGTKALSASGVARSLAAHDLVVGAAERYLRRTWNRISLGSAVALEGGDSSSSSFASLDDDDDADDDPGKTPKPTQQRPPPPLRRDDATWAASDWLQVEGLCHLNIRPRLSVSALWAVADFTEENGAPRVAVGSHRQCPRTKEPPEDLANIETASMRTGDVLLWDAGLFHGPGAGQNSGALGLRFVYNVGWMPSDLSPISNADVDAFSDRLKELVRAETMADAGPGFAYPPIGGPASSIFGDGVPF